METARIEKQVLLRAPPERVWRALVDARQFGSWFGAQFDAPFAFGARVPGRIVPTTMDSEVARLQEAHRGTPFEVVVERMDPMRAFAFRWDAYPPEPGEEAVMTLVTFTLEPVAEGTRLTIVESGFDAIPVARRAKAFTDNDGGWALQAQLVKKYVEAGWR